jgi:hypothetical protein
VTELELRFERVVVGAMLAVAERDRLEPAIEPLRRRRADLAAGETPGDGRMAQLARRAGLAPAHVDFLWAAACAAGDPRAAVHLEALGGSPARRGLAPAVYARVAGIGDAEARALAIELARPNPLVDHGLVTVGDDQAVPVNRAYAVPPRVLSYLTGDDRPAAGLVRVMPRDGELVFDDAQRGALVELAIALTSGEPVVVLEGAHGSGRVAAIAHAARRALVVLDGAAAGFGAGLAALRTETVLGEDLPVVAAADRAGEAGRGLGVALDRIPGPVVVTATAPVELGTSRPVVRVRWPLPDVAARTRLWRQLAGAAVGDLEALALRYRVGPGTIARAIASARVTRPGAALDADALAAGLRHNIAEQLGGLAQRIDVTQTWDDLVVADDTRDQVQALIARVRHAHQVLERWGYRGKMARGTGVAALFSGPPGTGKTMVAGLIARELDLELYQVDLSQVVSKWIGETEKQLARVFDVAEQGHALLLFDEADALFGQRSTEMKGAVDRYANLEVNFLLQRIEAFGGITVLTTNLDASIDRALKRRLAAHIVFDLPDEDERAALWRRLTTTGAAPLAGDVDPERLARDFAKMSGANIRNAALSAAFLAAADGAPQIGQAHLVRAARAEYRGMGHVLADRTRAG